MNAPYLPVHARAESMAHARAVAAWISSQEHATDCLCVSCAPVSTPTRSPSVNDALAGECGVELAQVVTLFTGLKPYGRRVAVDHLKALSGLQGKMGC